MKPAIALYKTALIVTMACAALVVWLFLSNSNEPQTSSPTGTISISEIVQTYGYDGLTVDIRRPVVSGFSDKAFEAELNAKIENQISVAKDAAVIAAAQFQRDMKNSPIHWQFVFYSGWWLKSTEGIFSLKVTTLLDNGGTGMPLTTYYNADIETCETLKLGDLFRDDSYKEIIGEIIIAGMQKNPDAYSPEDFTGMSDSSKFFIQNGSLYIAFDKYEIACGSEGEPQFKIPAELIKSKVKPKYAKVLSG